MLEILDRHHGQVTGVFFGDECLAGRSPLQGTELCAVVELMYSLEHLFSAFGETSFGDRLERVAFNARPARFAPDMWSHQYDQQVNQVQCTVNPEHLFTSNGPESNIYGLEPNFGCCTANMHQGWPKLVAHLWMRTKDEGLVAAAWAPCEASFVSRGVPVAVRVDTDYPFRETLAVTVSPKRAVRFPLVLRVPAWADGATVSLAEGAPQPIRARVTSPPRAGVGRRDGAPGAPSPAAEGHDPLQRGRGGRARPPSCTRSPSARGGPGSMPTSPTGSYRTATSRYGPSASARSRRRARG